MCKAIVTVLFHTDEYYQGLNIVLSFGIDTQHVVAAVSVWLRKLKVIVTDCTIYSEARTGGNV